MSGRPGLNDLYIVEPFVRDLPAKLGTQAHFTETAARLHAKDSGGAKVTHWWFDAYAADPRKWKRLSTEEIIN